MSTFSGYEFYAANLSKSLQRVASEPTVARDQAYYEANIGKVTSVDQFLNNYRLFTHAMTAYGLQDLGNAKGLMKKVLESDLSDSHSFANSLSDTRYRNFAKAFQFGTKGAVANTTQAQTSTQEQSTTSRYAVASTASAANQKIATAYYNAHIGSVTSVQALESDTTLSAYVRTAYGLDSSVSDKTISAALESDLSDPASAANVSTNNNLKALAGAFNFASDGSVTDVRQIQSSTNITATVALYTAAAGTDTAATAETSYYTSTVPTITSVSQFISDKRLVAYVEKAYGIPSTATSTLLKATLTSNLSNSKSIANTMGGAYRTLAAAFDVSTSGTITREPVQQAQTKASIVALHDAYLEQTMETEAGQQSTGVKLALYFKQVAPTITSAYGILADKALTQVVQTMLGLPASSSNADIDSQARTISRKINITDFKDPVKLDRLIARFSALYDLKNSTSTGSSQTSTTTLTL